MKKIKIKVNDIEMEAELNNSETAEKIYNSLPVEGYVNRWGDEIYFEIPVKLGLEEGAGEVVEKGDLAYWPQGSCFCIFFGKTPASQGDEIRAASAVNVFGKIIGDAEIFKKVNDNDVVRIIKQKRFLG